MKKNTPHIYAETLTSKQKAFLKSKAHSLNTIVQIGQHGLTDVVMAEIESALKVKELIKVQTPGGNSSEDKENFVILIQSKLPEHAHFVSKIGRSIILYLEKDPKTSLIPLNN